VFQKQIILPSQLQIVFYRVAQEALNNVAKHAQAKHVKIALQLVDNVCSLQIVDDGSGFDPEVVSRNHLGLKIMKERADEIQASLSVRTGVGQGAEITLVRQIA